MFKIRQVCKKDNLNLSNVIRKVLTEIGVPKKGTAYSDPELDFMFETYNKERSIYYVVENNGKICGGAGIAHLNQADYNICELQKMYSLPRIRGQGLGQKLLNRCLESVQKFRFECCSIETIESLQNPVILYKCSGFFPIGGPIENTSHHNCGFSILKKLQ